MNTEKRPCWLTWTGLRQKPETHQLRAVSLTPNHARYALQICKLENEQSREPRQAWQEERETDHLYGELDMERMRLRSKP